MAEFKCICCEKLVLKAESRRRVGGPSSRTALSVYLDLCGIVLPGVSVVPPDLSKLFWCIPCWSKLERVFKMKADLKKLENEIKGNILRVNSAQLNVPVNTSQCLAVTNITTPTRSGPSSAFDLGQPSPKRRRQYSSPKRQILARTVVTGTPSVSVLLKRKKSSRVYNVSRSLKKLGKSVGRANRASIARQVVKDERIQLKVINLLSTTLGKEMKKLCSKRVNSLLRRKDCISLQEFNIHDIVNEMKVHAPSVLTLLRGCLQGRNRSRTNKTKSRVFDEDLVVGVCCAILLRGRSQRMSLLQRVISLILYCGHASKRVYTRLQKLCLSLSHKAMSRCVEKLGRDFDAPTVKWRDDIMRKMSESKANSPEDATLESRERVQREATAPGRVVSESSEESSSVCSLSSPPQPPEFSTCSSSSSTSSALDSSSSSSDLFSLSDVFGPEISFAPTLQSWLTFKVVGDNIDKNIQPQDMRLDNQTKSLHYFHVYTVRDRIDLSNYDDTSSSPDISSICVDQLLPSNDDNTTLRANYSILIARVLKKYIPFFKEFGNGLERHIRHQYYEEMSSKSEVVPLGILLKSEISYADMIAIEEDLHKYIPRITSTTTTDVTVEGKTEMCTIMEDKFHRILFGGDQLTAARARGAQRIRSNSERPLDRLEGLEPCCEDWHAKGVLLRVIWNRLYNTSSGMDAGTLFQIRNLINRRNVVKDPTNNVAASEDFILLVIEAHILSTAMTVLKMNSLDDTPSHDMFKIPADANSLQRREVLLKAANLVIDSFVDISFACGDEENKPPKKRRGKKRDNQPTNDGVKAYACEILNLGLLLMEFNDGIRENDGNRIVRCWQYMMLVFKANGRTNYSMEALNLLIQLHYTLSPRMAAQLKWNRTVNVHGRPGKNVSSDLHMEHLNRLCKNAISGMGANVTGQSIQRVGRAIKVLSETMQELDKHLGISQESDFHTTRSSDKDLKEVLKQIFEETCVFSHIPGRTHRNFPDFVPNSMRSLSRKKLEQWITTNANKILIYH